MGEWADLCYFQADFTISEIMESCKGKALPEAYLKK